MFLADFHIHTNQSDGRMALHHVIDLFGERGFGAIAITDHLCDTRSLLGKASRFLGCSLNEINFAQHMENIKRERDRAWQQYGMVVIPGYEITLNSISNHRSAHVLAIGIDQYVSPDLPIEEFSHEIRSRGEIGRAHV